MAADSIALDPDDTLYTPAKRTVRVDKAWESDTLMTTSESVLYDAERDLLYVSNINGQPGEKDGNGFISSVNLEGEVVEQHLFSGFLDAPKGMGINGNKLYVTDIDKLVEIDLDRKVSTNTWKIDTAKFLNDVAVGDDGTVYFSDSQTNTIYSLRDGDVSLYMHNDELNGPNGLFIDGSNMMVTSMNGSQLLKVDMNDNDNIEVITEDIGAGDGLVPVGDGSYLASSWNGEVFYIDQDGNKQSILNTQNEKINSADIEYIEEKNLLLVPTFFDNRIVAYKLSDDNSGN